jgi:hypothetical protein
MFKDISPDDRSIKEFKTYKQFTFTNSDTGSGVFGLEGISGSAHYFLTGSAASQSFGVFNEASKSFGHSWDTWYSCGTFFKLPLYFQINNSYYEYDKVPNKKSNITRFPVYTPSRWERKWPHGREASDWGTIVPRELHDTVNVITIPQQFFGEEIKPLSVKILDDSGATTLDIRDDGHGQLYDYFYSSSFAAGTPSGTPRTGGSIGNVFYEHGIITVTDTGSRYTSVGLGTGGDGWSVRFQATKTSYEYQYQCNIAEYQFTGTTNPSAVIGRSGSIAVPAGSRYNYNGKFEADEAQYESAFDLVMPPASRSYDTSYSGDGGLYHNFTTHSEFGTYVTNIGLYNDTNELLAIAKLSNPIKNDKDLPISFLVRFDS